MSAPRVSGHPVGAPRVGIVGARQERQGLGPYVARELRDAGAAVACFLATSPRTLELAKGALRESLGIEARGYLDIDELLGRERLDALAILSPPATHERYLEAALAAGVSVLCEKPFVWGGPGTGERAARIAAEFEARGLLIQENCQWPLTLTAFDRLHPGAREGAPSRFEMRLAPRSSGRDMIPDAVPHALSLLQAIAPGDARIEDLRISTGALAAPEIVIRFRYAAGPHTVESTIALRQGKTQPREAGYAINGFDARRLIRLEDYAIFFAAGARVVDAPDPLALLVRGFVSELARPPAGRARRAGEIARRARLLETIAAALEGKP